MKKVLSLGLAALLFASVIFAKDQDSAPNSHRFYVSGLAGAAFTEDFSERDWFFPTPGAHIEYELDTGYNLGAAFGYKFENFRLEAEALYLTNRTNKIKQHNVTIEDATGDIYTTLVFLNALYDINTGSNFIPYFGVGAGLNSTTYKFSSLSASEDNHVDRLGVQAIAGLSYVEDNLGVSLDYRYIHADSLFDDDFESHTINASISYYFG